MKTTNGISMVNSQPDQIAARLLPLDGEDGLALYGYTMCHQNTSHRQHRLTLRNQRF
jgi:hypothetical protein